MGLVGSWDPGIWLGIGWGAGLAVLGVSFGVLLGRPGELAGDLAEGSNLGCRRVSFGVLLGRPGELAGGQFWGPGGQVLGSGWGPG
jgi:hypothetical protein